MTSLTVQSSQHPYTVHIGQGLLSRASELFSLHGRRVFILTDTGVPRAYAEAIAAQCDTATVCTVPMGEGAKSLSVMESVLTAMMTFGMTRGGCLVAVGGGVVGDLGGFCAASYMRGIEFYNVPTTLLSQVDSSIGGKTAVNLGTVKNIVGAFYQPSGVLIDTDTLKTLPARQRASGIAEAVKMALTSDAQLFSLLEERGASDEHIEEIIARSLAIKRRVVEEDEKETGLRMILNFGHTLGHGIEAAAGLSGLLHGECVALGMLPVCSETVRTRLLRVLSSLGLPTTYDGSLDEALSYVKHDKKGARDGTLCIILVDEVGSCRTERMAISEFERLVKERWI